MNLELLVKHNKAHENMIDADPRYWLGRIGAFRLDVAPESAIPGTTLWIIQISIRPNLMTAETVTTLCKMNDYLYQKWASYESENVFALRAYVHDNELHEAVGDAFRAMFRAVTEEKEQEVKDND